MLLRRSLCVCYSATHTHTHTPQRIQSTFCHYYLSTSESLKSKQTFSCTACRKLWLHTLIKTEKKPKRAAPTTNSTPTTSPKRYNISKRICACLKERESGRTKLFNFLLNNNAAFNHKIIWNIENEIHVAIEQRTIVRIYEYTFQLLLHRHSSRHSVLQANSLFAIRWILVGAVCVCALLFLIAYAQNNNKYLRCVLFCFVWLLFLFCFMDTFWHLCSLNYASPIPV